MFPKYFFFNFFFKFENFLQTGNFGDLDSSRGMFFFQMGHFAGNYQNIFDKLFRTFTALAAGFQPSCGGNQTVYAFSGC